MLKKLELWGFKSFADKTVFEFGPGITAIVGPNGSGKSNIVDAIRWVLGEQSAKSLRGKEMADCIFNGSGTRKKLGFAEVTVTIDNSRRYLRYDGEEVAITRRVYRTGESQYFINKKPARLRDIRELLLGTGTSTQTYSIIEQGRVDALLQASSRERRLVFEEAAGIRAFRLRKQEALGRLEKVEQNLSRVQDILDEVKRRLKTVRSQASKAREYAELSKRLKELRIQIGVVEYRQLEATCRETAEELEAASRARQKCEAQLEVLTSQQLELDQVAESLERQTRQAEGIYAEIRQEIGRVEASLRHGRQRLHELQNELTYARQRWAELTARCQELYGQVQQLQQRLAQETESIGERERSLQEKERQLSDLDREVAQIEESLSAVRLERLQLERQMADLRNRATALESQIRTMQGQRQRYETRRSAVEGQLREAAQHAEKLSREIERLRSREQSLEQQLSGLKEQQAELARQEEALRGRQHKLTAHRAAVQRELDVYVRLERQRDGVSAGAQQLCDMPELTDCVLGLLANMIDTDREVAPLVDRVLGPFASATVVESVDQVLTTLRTKGVHLTAPTILVEAARVGNSDESGQDPVAAVEGAFRLVEMVRIDPRVRPVVNALMGDVWVVSSAEELGLVRSRLGKVRIITRSGELYEPFGAVTIGAFSKETGLVSRRSAIRELGAEIASIEGELQETTHRLNDVLGQVRHAAEQSARLSNELTEVRAAAQEAARELAQREQQRSSLEEELKLLVQEDMLLANELERLDHELGSVTDELQRLIAEGEELQTKLRSLEEAHEQLASARENFRDEIARDRVAVARERERHAALERELAAVRSDLEDRQRVRRQALDEIQRLALMVREVERGLLQSTGRLAQLYHRKDAVRRQIVELVEKGDSVREQRKLIGSQLDEVRRGYEELRSKLHEVELRQHDAERSLQSLVDRLLDEFQVDLRACVHEVEIDPHFDLKAASTEAKKLRRRLQSLGPVNVEAVRELEELEERERTLEEQRQDLLDAKQSLTAIIDRINEDSRRLFLATLEQVRNHFQELFRKLFGGGRADIVLDDPDDVLECGVEIVAKPPGKELRSISLLSGGEKTLTVVALLLAIFRSKPSPFCILDEVDAALDEANIDRFAAVLREFTDRSQFILITHSKKTMLHADVLYGVTMQESGVSKRISVRLEDISDNGEIRAEALGGEQPAGRHEAAA